MNNIVKLSFFFILFVLLSCGNDDPTSSACAGLNFTGSEVTIDGEENQLFSGQLLITPGFDGDAYLFQLSSFSNDCLNNQTLSFTVELPSNQPFNGTYPIVDFFDSDIGDVTSMNYTVSKLDGTVSQILKAIESGTFMVEDHGGRDYEIDIDAVFVGGGDFSYSVRHDFE